MGQGRFYGSPIEIQIHLEIPGIEHGTSPSEDNNVTTEQCDRTYLTLTFLGK